MRARQLVARITAVILVLAAVLGTLVKNVVEKWLEAAVTQAGQTAGGWLGLQYLVSFAIEGTGPPGAVPLATMRIRGWEAIGLICTFLLVATILGWTFYRWAKDLQNQLNLDTLTGALGPRGLRRKFDRRKEDRLVMVLVDLIRFHEFNREYGQAGGDKILAAVGHMLRGETKFKEDVGRYGGDEFMMLMEGELTAIQFGLKARQKDLKDLVVQEIGSVEVRFRAGMTETSDESFDNAYEKASQALRDVKMVQKEFDADDPKTYVRVWRRSR